MTFLQCLNTLAIKFGLPPYVDNFTGDSWPIFKGSIDDEKYLYHYTSQEAAFQILEHKTLHATDAHFLNDTAELQLGRSALENALNKFPSDSFEKEMFSAAVEFLLRPDKPENHEKSALKRGRAYVVSLSTEKDDRSQWQSYGGNGGVALGFSCKLLAQTQPDAMLAPVIYTELTKLTELLYEDMLNILDSVQLIDAEKRRQMLIERYALFTALVKSPDFESENEWRLVVTEAQVDRRSASWRQSSNYAIPYLKLALWDGGKPSQPINGCLPKKRLKKAYVGCRVMVRKGSDPLVRFYYDSRPIPVEESRVTLRV